MQIYGVEAIIRICSHIIFIVLAFRAMQSLRVEEFFRKARYMEIRLFYFMVSIALGYTVSSFFWEVLTLFRNFMLSFIS